MAMNGISNSCRVEYYSDPGWLASPVCLEAEGHDGPHRAHGITWHDSPECSLKAAIALLGEITRLEFPRRPLVEVLRGGRCVRFDILIHADMVERDVLSIDIVTYANAKALVPVSAFEPVRQFA